MAEPTSQEPDVVNVDIAILGQGYQGGMGDLCALDFHVLPAASRVDESTVVPLHFTVCEFGAQEQPSTFSPLTLEFASQYL